MEKEGPKDNGFIQGNIPLILNSYADIFSSFDSRPYSEKALSVDFLEECRRAVRDKADIGLELTLSVPKERRNLLDEIKIKKRFRDHFRKHSLEKEKEIRKIKREGLAWVFIGTVLMIFVTLIQTYVQTLTFFFHLLIVIFTPAGWFSFWEGLGKIFIESRKLEPEYNFYKKMSNAHFLFKSY